MLLHERSQLFSSNVAPCVSGKAPPSASVPMRGVAHRSLNVEAAAKTPDTQPLASMVTVNVAPLDVALSAPLLSVAVTVIVTVPSAIAVIVREVPSTDTVAMAGSEEVARMVWVSPALPSDTVTSTVDASPTVMA